MFKNKRAFTIGIILLSIIVFFVNISIGIVLQAKTSNRAQKIFPTAVIPVVSYSGRDNTDALTLLKEHATVKQDASGMVVSINNYQARAVQHEYWAFYINEKLAQVGPADYKTKNSDIIQWRIAKY